MNFSKPTFSFRKKKKKFPALEALKTISLLSSSALAVNRSLKEKIKEQQYLLQKQKRKQSDDNGAIIAGLVGGLLAGSIIALLFAPESGEKLREKISDFFLTENGHDLEDTLDEARQSARENLGLNGGS